MTNKDDIIDIISAWNILFRLSIPRMYYIEDELWRLARTRDSKVRKLDLETIPTLVYFSVVLLQSEHLC